MGIIVEAKNLHAEHYLLRLFIYTNPKKQMVNTAFSANKPLAEELLKLKPSRRTMQLEKCFMRVLSAFPEKPVIKDIDVMFNPAYKIDVMKVLTSAYKQKPFTLVWPGSYEDGRLVYSNKNYQDYRTFEIMIMDIRKRYSVTCHISIHKKIILTPPQPLRNATEYVKGFYVKMERL